MSGIEAGLYEFVDRQTGQEIRLRLQRAASGSVVAVSADLSGGPAGIASFVSRSDIVESGSGITFDAMLYPPSGPAVPVRARIARAGADAITLSGDFGVGPVRAGLVRIGSALRRLTLVVDAIDGFDVPDDSLLGGSGGTDVASCLAKASIAVSPVPHLTVRPDPYGRTVHTPAELHELMTRWGKPPARAADPWWLNVLMGGRFDGRGYGDVSGVLYDVSTDEDSFPRQGVAVFLASKGIAEHAPGSEDWKREVLFTLVHEIGHGLNLPHAFDEGRDTALTWMNYPSRLGPDVFWKGFDHSFDERERHFLCHAPHADIAPGACAYATRRSDLLSGGRVGDAAFRHVPGPEDGDERARPRLEVGPLKPHYVFGEPVFLKVALVNEGTTSLRYAKAFDPSDGLLTVTIVKPHGEVRIVRSPFALCQDHRLRRLGPGQRVAFDGIFVAFDADGAIFDEPGRYTLSARYAGVPGHVLTAPETRLRVLHPTRDEERVAILVWDKPLLMRAIGLRQPLIARDDWETYREAVTHRLPIDPGNTTPAFLTYTAALGWMKPHKPACAARGYEADLTKARAHLRQVHAAHLPSGVVRKKRRIARERRRD